MSQKGKKIVDFIQAHDFAFQRFFCISHITLRKMEYKIWYPGPVSMEQLFKLYIL